MSSLLPHHGGIPVSLVLIGTRKSFLMLVLRGEVMVVVAVGRRSQLENSI